jgi:hypothetical protein
MMREAWMLKRAPVEMVDMVHSTTHDTSEIAAVSS